jgi:hypothetical protein
MRYKNNMLKVLNRALFIFASVFFTGCVANLANSIGVDVGSCAQSYEKFVAGEYRLSAEIALGDKDEKSKLDEANLLSALQAGNSYFFAKEYKNSLKMLDASEDIIKFHHKKTLSANTSDYIASLMLNDMAIDYHASISEAVMVNTYKSLDYMALKKFEQARVELNRAVERQRRAKETYAELIAKQKDAIAEKKREQRSDAFDKTLNNPQIKSIIRQNYSTLEQFEAYPDFINPFTTYLAGLFFAIEGDYAKASSLLKEAYGMSPHNKTVESDFEMVENALLGKLPKDRFVWIIYENGLGPIKKEFKINIPIFLASNKLIYTGIALPKLQKRQQATQNIAVFSQGKLLDKTSVISDMNRVIQTEFNYVYNDILTRAIFSAMLKTYAQYQAGDENPYLGLATAVFQLLTNRADIRSWNTLPKDFQVVKVKIPESNKLLLRTGVHNIDINIDKDVKHSIVYVRIPKAMSKPSVNVINF